MNDQPPRQIPMSKPDINEEDVEAVVRVLRSGQLSMGPCIEQFEERLRTYVGSRYAIAIANGTAGLHLCMRLAGVAEGREVITSPFSFVASTNCILYERGTPAFVDIDEATFNLDPAGLADAVNERTVAILPIHVFGRAAAMETICQIAEKRSITVIEDACEAIGSELHHRRVGTFGRAAVFAFYPNKQMTTGEGGIITTDDPIWNEALRSLRNHGRSGRGASLEHDRLGYNYRLDEMSASLGASQLARIDNLLERRASVAARYTERLERIPGVQPLRPTPEMTRMSWFVYVVRFERGISRDKVAMNLSRQGIPTRNYFPPIHLQPFYRERYGFKPGQFPVTERVSDSALALPFHTNLDEEDIDRTCEILAKAIDAVTAR